MEGPPSKPRPKAFVSMDSLWYEEERIATFIDWPVPFISSRELAQEGFYYLRTKDHCACAFCRGIIGAWEKGDTPRGEHKRHFPYCPFVQGKVTPNVPLKQGSILSRFSSKLTDVASTNSKGQDVCGIYKMEDFESCPETQVLTLSSSSNVSMASLGFRQYCGPKRKEYLTTEVRLNSYKHWPEKVIQTPSELAEAGFYYCGLSDHVRCFHCGNGLRNWEPADKPWEEHARWFPDCHFVLLKKGIEFVDKVRRERPPYIPVRGNGSSSSSCNGVSYVGNRSSSSGLTENELEKLMELEIMRHVLEMGFAKNVVKSALRKRVLETGQPFFSVETCIDSILIAMEEETKSAISGCEDITSQARKMAAYENAAPASDPPHHSSPPPQEQLSSSSSSRSPMREESTEPSEARSSALEDETSPQISVSTSPPTSLPPLPNRYEERPSSSQSPLPPLPPPLRSSTPTLPLDNPHTHHGMDVEAQERTRGEEETPAEEETPQQESLEELPEESQSTEGSFPAAETSVRASRDVSQVELPSEVVPLISEADDIMEEAAKLLSPPSLVRVSSQSSSTSNSSQESHSEETDPPPNSSLSSFSDKEEEEPLPTKTPTEVIKNVQQTENLALELEKMREDQMCKVCMDNKMDVVFLPCTHMVTCSSCAVALAACPICRCVIKYAFKPIIP